METTERIVELIRSSMTQNHESVERIREAIRLADAAGETLLGIAARSRMMQLARGLLLTGELTAAFTWTLAKFDEDPEKYAEYNPLYEFRWVVSLLGNFPTISIQKRDELLQQMTERYEAAGYSRQSVDEVRISIAADYADPQLAADALAALRQGDEREMEYSVRQREIEYWILVGNDAKAVQCGAPYLSDPKFDAYFNPQVCAQLLLPLTRLGQHQVADAIERRVRKRMGARPNGYFWHYGDTIVFWALTSDRRPKRLDLALDAYVHFQPIISEYCDPLTRLHFYLDSLPVMNRLLACNRIDLDISLPEDVRSDLPAASAGESPSDDPGTQTVSTRALRTWIIGQAVTLAAAFDERNGNTYFHDALDARKVLGQPR